MTTSLITPVSPGPAEPDRGTGAHPPSPPEPVPGWCVRLDWPDGRHDLVAFHTSATIVKRRMRKLEAYWSGPAQPRNLTMVPINGDQWLAHPRRSGGCAAPGCPR